VVFNQNSGQGKWGDLLNSPPGKLKSEVFHIGFMNGNTPTSPSFESGIFAAWNIHPSEVKMESRCSHVALDEERCLVRLAEALEGLVHLAEHAGLDEERAPSCGRGSTSPTGTARSLY